MFLVALLMKKFTFFPLLVVPATNCQPLFCFHFDITTDLKSFIKRFHKQMEMKRRFKWYKIQDFHCQNLSIFFIC